MRAFRRQGRTGLGLSRTAGARITSGNDLSRHGKRTSHLASPGDFARNVIKRAVLRFRGNNGLELTAQRQLRAPEVQSLQIGCGLFRRDPWTPRREGCRRPRVQFDVSSGDRHLSARLSPEGAAPDHHGVTPPKPPVLQNSSAPGRRSAAAIRWVLCIGGAVLLYALIRAIT